MYAFHEPQSETNATKIKRLQKLQMTDPILALVTYVKIKKIFIS